jgi:hypothetical protein
MYVPRQLLVAAPKNASSGPGLIAAPAPAAGRFETRAKIRWRTWKKAKVRAGLSDRRTVEAKPVS